MRWDLVPGWMLLGRHLSARRRHELLWRGGQRLRDMSRQSDLYGGPLQRLQQHDLSQRMLLGCQL